jgi:hypothetical protein
MSGPPQVGWIPVILGDAYALRQFVRRGVGVPATPEARGAAGSPSLPVIPEGQRVRVQALLNRIEEVEDQVNPGRRTSDQWGVAL